MRWHRHDWDYSKDSRSPMPESRTFDNYRICVKCGREEWQHWHWVNRDKYVRPEWDWKPRPVNRPEVKP